MNDLSLTLDISGVNLDPQPAKPQAPRQLLRPLPTPGHFLLVIDNSSLEVFTTCPKSADYKLVRRREAHARNAALTFGGALHEGLERFLYWQTVIAKEPNILNLNKEVAMAQEIQDQAIVRFFTENPTPLDEYRTVQNALAVLAAYRQRAALPDYQWEIQRDDNGPIIERAFELPLGVVDVGAWIGMPWLSVEDYEAQHKVAMVHQDGKLLWVKQIHIAWSGRIDAIARCGGIPMNRVVDHKSGRVDPQEYQISNPVLGYVWAGRQLWPDLNISGFCLNALATKKPTAGCSMTSLGPRGGKPALDLFRAYFEYSPERLEQWAENTLAIVSDFIHCVVRDYYPRHTKWCHGKYGPCPYLPVCTQDDPIVRANMLQSDMFKPVTWNPVAGR